MDRSSIVNILEAVEPIFEKEPQLIIGDIGDFLIVGDTHGDYETTLKALKYAEKEGLRLLFLGDYVDRGPRQVENIVTLLESKLSWRNNLILLRGNHETVSMNRWYGFMDIVYHKYDLELYELFARLFSKLPYAALINGKVFTVHGGIAEGLKKIDQVNSIPKGELDPLDKIGLQLLWNDPSEDIEWFAPSWRGGGAKLYGWRAFNEFMEENKLELLVRAHEPQPNGYGELFNGRLKTVFSCRFYGITPSAIVLEDGLVKNVVSLE
ncbi:MAG: metallophosphoesterase [Nitrososphaerota archaeon]|nr:metallophosphoesterase [Candidatus Geocrenenecus dongiae]